ncbi:MAG: addiction module toxin RelE [Candidatus Woesearchaeota archaeon]
MYDFERSDKLIKILRKLFRRDKVRYEATMKKIQEVIASDSPQRYKNLSYDLSGFKGIHIDSHFVLIFKIDERNRQIRFEDLQHHDTAYER